MTGNGSSGIPTYNLGDPQYLMQGGADAYAAKLAYEERREMLECGMRLAMEWYLHAFTVCPQKFRLWHMIV
jgi:hypothetical protein